MRLRFCNACVRTRSTSLSTSSAQTTRDIDGIDRHIDPAERAFLTDVRAMLSVLSMIGLTARELIAQKIPDELLPGSLKFSPTARSTWFLRACARHA